MAKVLIVDDEQKIADTLALIFAGNGYEARAAYDPKQATEMIAEWLPDLIIVDVVLTRMSGIDLAILVKDRFPACRVVLFSGQAATAELLAEAASKGHTFEILPKPFPPKQMLLLAQRLLTSDTAKL